MGVLYWLEGIRIPVLNEFMLAVTQLGDESAFLVIALVMFWCVDKRRGYYLMSVGFVGTIFNQFMKLWFRIPRPWVLDENFSILEQAREGAGGYSFPSGHTQSSVGTYGSIAYTTKDKVVRIICIVLAFVVPFSRMYIGVHTPLDVLTAAAIAIAVILLLYPIVMRRDGKYIPYLLAGMTVLAVGYVLFVERYPFPGDINQSNLVSGTENAYTLLGAVLGMIVVYVVDTKWLNFRTNGVWWVQILKIAGGLALVLVVKSGTKELLNSVMGEFPGRSVRYFLTVITAGVIWPLTFTWFELLGYRNKSEGKQ